MSYGRIFGDQKGPLHISTFLWKVGHNRIMTAFYRSKWSSSSVECHHCPGEDESIIHVLCDCLVAAQTKLHFVDPEKVSDFFSWPQQIRLSNCLSQDLVFYNSTGVSLWNRTFRVTCWMLWKWSNCYLFENNFSYPNNPCEIMQNFVNHILNIIQFPTIPSSSSSWSNIRWNRPLPGWVKVNLDGASKGNPGSAVCGGLIRAEDDAWILGFMHNIGTCTALLNYGVSAQASILK